MRTNVDIRLRIGDALVCLVDGENGLVPAEVTFVDREAADFRLAAHQVVVFGSLREPMYRTYIQYVWHQHVPGALAYNVSQIKDTAH